MAVEEPPKLERELFFSEEILYDTENYLGYLVYVAEVAKEEGTLDRLPVDACKMNT
jgi:hypothetical protein